MPRSTRQITAAKSTAKTKQSEKSVLAIISLLHKWGIHTFGE
jgi:hypothetical protein